MAYPDGWPSTTSAQLQILDDVANQDVDMQPVNDTIYIVVDTNILLHHLKILRNFVEDIVFSGAPITVICPGIVLNELDYQKNQPELGRLARNATDWMMREVTRKDMPQPIVKGQAQRETCKSTRNWKVRERGEVSSNDDMIIDCCKYFQSLAPVILYTGDKNLCLKCDQEGLRFVSPPLAYEYTSLDLVKCVRHILPDYGVYFDRMIKNYGHVARVDTSTNKGEEGMKIDSNVQVYVPQAVIVHLQVIERFVPLLKALIQRVGGEELKDLGKSKDIGVSVSKYAPRWKQKDKVVEEWDVADCLEYLQDKKKVVFTRPDPPLERFLQDPYSGNGGLTGAEWSASAWRAAASSLRRLGETWEDDAILQNVELLDQYIKSEYA